MTFDLPTAEGWQGIAYPFEHYGKFVHLAATVDAQQGKMVLYENGRQMAERRFENEAMPNAHMAFGKAMWYANRNPFRGSIDEATVWNRILSEKEVRWLAQSSRSVLWAWGEPGALFQMADRTGLDENIARICRRAGFGGADNLAGPPGDAGDPPFAGVAADDFRQGAP